MTISPASGLALESIADVDPVLWEAMLGERRRQHDKIELIASENYTSAAVMEAQGSWLTNKYAEGLPGKRYYGGCEYVDIAETPRPGARPRSLPRRRARQRPAAFGRPGEHGRLLQRPRAGRPDHGHEPRPRRPPDPRHGAQLLGPALRGPCLRRPPGHRADRLRRDGGAGEGGPPEAHRRWRVARIRGPGTSSGWHRSPRMSARSCSSTWPTSPASSRPGVHPSPFPHADLVTTTTHKTLRGPRGGMIFSRRTLRPGLDAADFPIVKNGAADGALAPRSTERPSRASRAVR